MDLTVNNQPRVTTRVAPLSDRIEDTTKVLQAAGSWRDTRILQSNQGPRVVIEGRERINLASNDYLGFSNHPFLKQRAVEYVTRWGAGSGAVRHIAGSLTIHEEFEAQLAKFKHAAAATVLQSGFATNQGVLGALLREGDVVASDELNHASIIDGLRLTRATRTVYRHADPEHLDQQLRSNPTKGLKLIVTDGVFSMDGDVAPLDRIMEVARRHEAVLYVDDAHGSGVLGRSGRGTADHFGLHGEENLLQIGTLSKAWGVVGGYAVGPKGLDKLLRNSARPLVFSTSHPPAVVGAASAAIELIEREPHIMERMWENTTRFRSRLQEMGFDTMGSVTPIVPVGFQNDADAAKASQLLFEQGLFTVAIAYPVVPKGKARIRNIITARHSDADLDEALHAYEKVGRSLGVI